MRVPIIGRGSIERMKRAAPRWGLVNRWARDNRRASQCINAKAQTLERRSTFSEAFQQRRCVVPADGLHEWTGPKNKRQPLWIHPRSGGLMLFAGLYESCIGSRISLRSRS
jgi:putative SOS response-associated peptidase YedK